MTEPKNGAVVSETDHKEWWRLEQLALISQVATQVTSILDLDELLVRVVGLIYQTFEFYVVALYTLDDEVLISRAQAGPAETFRVEDAFIPASSKKIPLGRGIIGWVAEHQQELVVRDVQQEVRFAYAPEWPETRAEIALPLKIENRLLGVLDVQLDYPEDFDEADLLVLRSLAGQVSMAIEDTRLYAEAKRRGDHLATISAVTGAIASILDVSRLLEKVSELIQRYFGYPCVRLFTVDYGQNQVEQRAGSYLTAGCAPGRPVSYSLDDPESVIAFVARSGQTLYVDEPHVAAMVAQDTLLATRTELVVPLIYNERVLGVLDLQSEQVNAFALPDRQALETLGANVAIALRNANLYSSERWRHQVAESLRRISGTLLHEVSLGHILDTILVELKRNLPSEVLAIWLIRNQKLHLVALQPPDPIEFVTDFEASTNPWLAQGLAATTEPLIRQSDDSPDPIAAYLGYGPEHSAIAAPLRVQGREVGLLTLAHSQAGRYGQEAKDITTAFANQAAIAIENARLFRLAQEEIQINNALLQVAEMTQSFGDLSSVLAAVVKIPPLMAGVGRCAIWLRNTTTEQFDPEAAFGFRADHLEFFDQHPLTRQEVLAVERLAQTHASIVVTDAAADPRLPAKWVQGLGLETMMLLPLIAHGELLGLMLVTFAQPAAIRQEGIQLITGVAHQAAVAIESKYLYNKRAEQERLAHELNLAHNIQANLIPSWLPAPAGWSVATRWEAIQAVGGDFYDFIEVGPDLLGIVIADASGKGMPAALYMALTRSLLRAIAPGQTDPRIVLARTNQLLVPDSHQGMFISVFYAILNTKTGVFRYANAGHNPPFLMKADGTSQVLRLHGMVLGVQAGFEPEAGRRQLKPGEGVVLYTDGVVEVTDNAGNLFGQARLEAMLKQYWSAGPQAVVAAVHRAVSEFSATTLPTDDFTLLALRRLAPGAPD